MPLLFHAGKIKDERDIKNTDNTETKHNQELVSEITYTVSSGTLNLTLHNQEKANNTKHSKRKLAWFVCVALCYTAITLSCCSSTGGFLL